MNACSGTGTCLEVRHGDRQERDLPFIRVMLEDRAHKVLSNLCKNRRRRNRRAERYGAGDRVEIGKANANRDRPTGQGFGPKPGTDPVSEMA
jgi:hypothetical protein